MIDLCRDEPGVSLPECSNFLGIGSKEGIEMILLDPGGISFILLTRQFDKLLQKLVPLGDMNAFGRGELNEMTSFDRVGSGEGVGDNVDPKRDEF